MTGVGPLELLAIEHLLSEEERDIQATVREFVDRRVRPTIADAYERGEPDLSLMPEAGALGLLGMHLEGYGCAGTNAVAYGWLVSDFEGTQAFADRPSGGKPCPGLARYAASGGRIGACPVL